jgi:hypothetical protein
VPLPVAIRAYPLTAEDAQRKPINPRKRWRLPGETIVFDTETRTDATQRLTFGGYRAVINGECVEEGLFYADDLSRREVATLRRYVARNKPYNVLGDRREMRLLSVREFLQELFLDAYKARCLWVAFNHPFDLSRIASDYASARGRYQGGFSLGLWTYIDKNGVIRRHPFRPRIAIKHIDSKRALIAFTGRKSPDLVDLIPDGSTTGKPLKIFQGNFLDLRTLAFALTDSGHSLESACKAFNVEHPKQRVAVHGKITGAYIDYNRRDVLATAELADKLMKEYEKHDISTQATKVFSPASIGKGYLRDMGVQPVLRRQPQFPNRYLGYAQSAFYGGRTSAHIRKVAVPVVYTDFLSMYPTVNSLMGLWRFVIARKIQILSNCVREVKGFLNRIEPDDLFEPKTWKHLHTFVRVIPNNDLLPVRSKFSTESNDWQVSLNYLSGFSGKREDAIWFSLPDVVVSKLLTGRVPEIVDAFRMKPEGVLEELQPLRLRSAIDIDPRKEDFFKVVIEERKTLASRKDLDATERKRLDKALKVLANATSYGIYAEMHRQESEKKVKISCQGIDPRPFPCQVIHPETPGEYCFPPFASLITGAARLMLGLLEHCVTELGGTYAMEDTDSMAIVATETGGMVPCNSGKQSTDDGKGTVKALSWKQVEKIRNRFKTLNPYDPRAISGSILKIEDDNYDPETRIQREIYCLAISAKRYALFTAKRNGAPVLLRKETRKEMFGEDRWSEHGLGHLLNPTDPENEDREWIAHVWLNIVRRSLGFSTKRLGFEDRPAISRISVSSPVVIKSLENLNRNKKYCDQIKPFNFLISCHVKAFGHPLGVDTEHFHLISPYDANPNDWLKKEWIDEYTSKSYGIRTWGHHGDRNFARVKTYGEVIEEYEFHPESKCADKDGNPCEKQTVGLLQRRHVRIDQLKFIGKESNSLENVESGLEHDEKNVYTEYVDKKRDDWATKVLPALKRVPLELIVRECHGKPTRRPIIELRAGRSRPQEKNRQVLTTILKKLGYL